MAQTIRFSDFSYDKLASIGLMGDMFRRNTIFGDIFSFEPPVYCNAVVPAAEISLQIGAFSYFWGSRLRATNIGRYCSIATSVVTGDPSHPIDRLTTSAVTYYPNANSFSDFMASVGQKSAPGIAHNRIALTTIGHDVWVGEGAFIKSGITIGTGAIIGARAVVTRDVPPYHIVGGSPAKTIRARFDDKTIERLLASQWWQYNILPILSPQIKDPNSALNLIENEAASGRLRAYEPEPITLASLLTAMRPVHAAQSI